VARLVNQRTRWRDLVNGYDPASIPGVPADAIEKMETEESKELSTSDANLFKVVRGGLVKNPCYLELIGQNGSTPHEFYEDMVRDEK